MTFLKIGVGAKAIGMGESQVADADDLYAIYWNPAGLAQLQRPQLGLMHNEWFDGLRGLTINSSASHSPSETQAHSAGVSSTSLMVNLRDTTSMKAASPLKQRISTLMTSL